ncbi:leucyl/phenylalanyl-tRNA--protein transferase [Vibrio ostreicida]|uniref:Leucyl/phenylalanyl-tRNA--protein transferase n=1 Tax=Vibrio ostreicida TaxID=526588 RepID=A0ABT8BSA4_9VIBR|nr:leucyl/phenylalanyl-tRNA--protein transferase [Vibrio ostreicida]MDN3609583.1 leucyl/phenylalanyl-tRNA--protein transferase [Vibrio ostreicida]NPD08456.1 leucyl/phenylalanyl-tRNA--protein transferase [Vibrio ostreicida]
MAIYLTELDESTLWFPSPDEALDDPNGLLAFGGDLSPERLLLAYQQGIFPWYGPGEPLLWWSPSPRAVFDPKAFKPAKSLRKFQKKHRYQISINRVTEQVIDHCAAVRTADETWLNEDMRKAYKKLARLGHCHSVEVWNNEKLIGGLYGLSIGQMFCGESMFSLETNASKIALWYFCEHFNVHGGQLIDCQVINSHLLSLGAQELDRQTFMQSLLSFKQNEVMKNCFEPQWLTFSSQESQ